MDLLYRCDKVWDPSLHNHIRLCTAKPITIQFCSKNELAECFQLIKNLTSSIIFAHESTYLLTNLSNKLNEKVKIALKSLCGNGKLNTLLLYFDLDFQSDDHTPTFHLFTSPHKKKCHFINIDFICPINVSDIALHQNMCEIVSDFLDHYHKALLYLWETLGSVPNKLCPHHYCQESFMYTILYPWKVDLVRELEWRKIIHNYLNLPTDTSYFRRGQAMLPVPRLSDWLGPNSNLLVCPHENLKIQNGEDAYVVKGRYTYKHYLQDGIDDKNWGCAYRSLQTLISWLMWQGEINPGPLPSLNEIQSSLVRLRDKPQSFIGSRQWIGSLEVSFCLQEMYSIQCRIVPVSNGSLMSQIAAPVLVQHFSSGGGPVMIGGGQLAHTIIGIQTLRSNSSLSEHTGSNFRYLILDPHFTGPSGDLKLVLEKGWCGWKSQQFWKKDVHYNLCFLPSIKHGIV